MGWSYKNLWHILIEKNLKKTDLIKLAHINSNAITHMGKNEPVTMDTLEKLCKALDCTLNDIVEYVPDK